MLSTRRLILAVLVTGVLFVSAGSISVAQSITPTATFLLIGQSNMNGYSRYSVPREAGDEKIAVWMGGPTGWEYLPVDTTTSRGMKGPALAFGRAYVARTGSTIGFVNCARGGSSIAEWQKGPRYGSLLWNCLANFGGSGGALTGALVYQGEADAQATGTLDGSGTTVSPATWGLAFGRFVADLRAETSRPQLRVVFAQLAHTTTPAAFPNWGVVQDAQAAIVIPGVRMVPTEPANLIDDVHLDDASAAQVGRRMESAWSVS